VEELFCDGVEVLCLNKSEDGDASKAWFLGKRFHGVSLHIRLGQLIGGSIHQLYTDRLNIPRELYGLGMITVSAKAPKALFVELSIGGFDLNLSQLFSNFRFDCKRDFTTLYFIYCTATPGSYEQSQDLPASRGGQDNLYSIWETKSTFSSLPIFYCLARNFGLLLWLAIIAKGKHYLDLSTSTLGLPERLIFDSPTPTNASSVHTVAEQPLCRLDSPPQSSLLISKFRAEWRTIVPHEHIAVRIVRVKSADGLVRGPPGRRGQLWDRSC